MANPTLLEMPIARDGAKNSIPSTTSPTTGLLSQQYGWQDINSMPVQQGGKAPSRLDFNGVLNLLSNILFYTQKGWQFEWDSSQSYYAGCVVKDTSDGKMYMCINDVTSTTAPHSDTTNWKLWDLSMLANYLPLVGGGALTGTSLTWNGNDLGSSAIVAKSIGLSGYIKYASGLIMQWGRTDTSQMSESGSGRQVEINLPISFSSGAGPRVSVTNPCISGTQFTNLNTWSYCSTSKIVVCDNDVASTMYIVWLAIGY